MASSGGRNSLVVLLTLACVSLGVLAWWQHSRLLVLEAQLDSAARQQDAAQKRIDAADARVAELEAAASARPRDGAARTTAPASSPPAESSVPMRRGPGGVAAALNNPDFQQAVTAGIRGNLDARYAMLFKKLKLAPTELEKLKNLLVDRQAAGLDVLAVSTDEGMTGPNAAENMRALMQKAQADVDEGIHAVLGDARFEQYKEYDRNASSYAVADQLDRRLSYTQTPLQPAQADELVRILAENAPAPPSESGDRMSAVFGGGNPLIAPFVAGNASVLATGGQSPITDAALEQAQGILTSEQFQSLKELQAEQQAMGKLLQSRGRMGFRAGSPRATSSRPDPGP